MIKIIKKACDDYTKLGSNTRLIIRITTICVITLCILFIYCEKALNNPYYYELISLSEQLIPCARSFIGVGFLGIVTIGTIEKNSNY